MTDATTCEVPLTEQLRQVPALSRLVINDGEYSTTYIPVGFLMHKAADLIDAQVAEIEELKAACRDAHTAEAEAMAVLLGCEERVERQAAEITNLRAAASELVAARVAFFDELDRLRREKHTLEFSLLKHGFKRCDQPNCCGGWHGGYANERLLEISDALQQAGISLEGETLLSTIKRLIRLTEITN